MEKNKNISSKLPTYDKNNLEKTLFNFQRHILNYIGNIPEIKKNLLFLSLDGKTGSELMRSFSWKLYLKTLSSDKNTTLKTWLEETLSQRKAYKKKVKDLLTISKFKGDPLGGLPVGGQSNSGWGDFFDKADIKHLIKIDVDRTFQDRDLFCESSIKEIENNILYLFAKGNQPTSYKQGMNDILAMLIYSLYPYYVKSDIKNYTPELFDRWVNEPIDNLKDIYNFFHDETEFQSDLYYLMVNLMKLGVNKFYEDVDLKKNPGETKNYLVKRCEFISEKKLKLQNSRLYHHFVNIGIDSGIILQRWIKCLFTREFHPQDCSVIWDAILANELMEPSGELLYIDYFSIAMMDFISDELLRKDQSECFKRLFQYPPLESMTTLITLTAKIKPKIMELEKGEILKEIEWKEKAERNKQQLNEIAEVNQKMRKELEENIAMNKQNNTANINPFMFANQMNIGQNQNPMFINNPNIFLSPQFNQLPNQQVFPQMNIMFNNNVNSTDAKLNNSMNIINVTNVNNAIDNKEKKEKTTMDIIKTNYVVNDEEKTKMILEIKTIMNKYKLSFSNEDRMKVDYLFERLGKN
jgi:TBC1 domain family protein 5